MRKGIAQTYRIGKDDRIFIYGASFIGRDVYDILQKAGRDIEAFLDRDTAKFDEVKGKKVYSPDGLSLVVNPETDIVIVAVTDRNEHINIANALYSIGFRKIIISDGGELGETYAAIINMQKPLSSLDIPYYKLRYSKRQVYYAEERKETYLVDIPSEMIFYENDAKEIKSVYSDSSLLVCYNFLEGRDNITSLKECYSGTEDSLPRWIEKERVAYRHMTQDWEKGNLLPSSAKYIGKGRFLIKEDVRVVFFHISKGYKKIQCEISKEDYNYWLQPEIIEKCDSLIQKSGISFVYTPILHPHYYDFPCKREECGYTRLMQICMYLGKHGIDVENKNVLDAGTYIGYFAQHMCRMGAKVTAVEYEKINYELAKGFNELTYCTDIRLLNMGIQELENSTKYDVTILLSVLDWHIETEIGMQILNKVDEVTTGILIWESGDKIERDKNWIFAHSSFNSYEKISDTFGTGRIREMGVFRRV